MGDILSIDEATIDARGLTQRFNAVEHLLRTAQEPDLPHPSLHSPANACIMIVDDEPINAKVVSRYLERGGYRRFVQTSDSTKALQLFHQEKPDVVLLDLIMPDVDGLQILREIRRVSPAGPPVLVLTATDDQQLKKSALDLGATDFLRKPVDPTDLVPRVRNALSVKAHQDRLAEHARQLEQQVKERTIELEASRLEVILCLGRAAEYRDNETGRHVLRVGRYVGVIGRAMQLAPAFVSLLEQAAPLHDMGKIGIPDAVLLKPGRLDAEEFQLMQRHTEYGYNIVATGDVEQWSDLGDRQAWGEVAQCTRSPLLRLAASIALTHHEKWDGSGYPRGLCGEDIPLEGRITAVADVFDALSSKRPYKPAFPLEQCFSIIAEGRGSHFDPQVVDAFLGRRDEIAAIRHHLADE